MKTGNHQSFRDNRGSAIIMALLFILGSGLLVASFLKYTLFELEKAHRSHYKLVTFYMAESGLEEAIWALRNDSWSGWADVDGDSKLLKSGSWGVGNGRTSSYRVLVDSYQLGDPSNPPVVYSEATTTYPDGETVSKQIKLVLATETLANPTDPSDAPPRPGIVARGYIDLSGGPSFDSYDSSKGDWHPVNNRGDRIVVATVGTSSDSFKISSDVEIYGFAGTGRRNIDFSGSNIRVHGDDTPSGTKIDKDRISNDFVFDFPDIDQPKWNEDSQKKLPKAKKGKYTIGDPSGQVTKYKLDKLELNGKDLVVVGPVQIYATNGVTVSGSDESIVIEGNGSMELYTAKDVTLSGQAIANKTGVPANAVVYGTVNKDKDQTLSLSGQAQMKAVFYMPKAVANISGQGELWGSLVAYEVKFSGQTHFHYDVQLDPSSGGPDGTDGNNGDFMIGGWYELNKASERIDFSKYDKVVIN